MICSVPLQFEQLLIYNKENIHKERTHQYGSNSQHYGVGYKRIETHATPAQTKEEVDEVADGEQLHGTAGIQCVAVREIGIATKVGIATEVYIRVSISNADECEHHLNQEYR